MMRRLKTLFIFAWLFLLFGTGCQSPTSDRSAFFSDQYPMPRFGYESFLPHEINGIRSNPSEAIWIRVIHDKPGSPYQSPRMILLRIDPSVESSSIGAWLALDDILGEEVDWSGPFFQQPVFFVTHVSSDSLYQPLSGPYHADDSLIAELLSRDVDFTHAFPSDALATNAIALIRDLKHCHGGKHRVYDDATYVIDWPSISRELSKLKGIDVKNDWPSSSIWIREESIYIWAPVLAAQGDTLGGIDGALSSGIRFSDGMVTGLWIDMN